jgi:phosphohistidine phosphatase
MALYLVHHGDAVGSGVDPMRPLSDRGRVETARLAEAAARHGATPDVVWHSGKLRARQTAALFWQACNPQAAFGAVHGLQPDDPPVWTRDRLAGETRSILLVGHMPHLPRLLAALLAGDPASAPASFPLHGCIALEPDGDVWKEIWRLGGEI